VLVADILRSTSENNFAALQAGRAVAERLVAMPTLGARRQSWLMAAMLQMCLMGDERSKIFPALLLQLLSPPLQSPVIKGHVTVLVVLAVQMDNLYLNVAVFYTSSGLIYLEICQQGG
jgi:hypothetical protein